MHAEELELPEGDWHVYRMEETGPGGNYAAQVTLPESGVYQLIMRDTTYPQEDAVAELIVALDGATELGEALFIFPPTDIGTASPPAHLAGGGPHRGSHRRDHHGHEQQAW